MNLKLNLNKWFWKVNGLCNFFLLGNFEDEIPLRGEVCNDPEFLSFEIRIFNWFLILISKICKSNKFYFEYLDLIG